MAVMVTRLTPSAMAWLTAALLLASGPLGMLVGDAGSLRNVQVGLSAVLFVLAWRAPSQFALPVASRAWLVLTVTSLVWLEFAAWSRWAALGVNGVDFSIFDWMLQSTHSGRFGYSPIYDVNHFGVHSSFLLLAVVPLHALWPGPGWLVTLGPVLVWAGLFPLRRLSRALVGAHGGLELALALAWLGNAWLGRLVNGVFRIESFVPVLTLWFLVAWVERKPRLIAGFALALLCSKEDTALALAAFGVAALVTERGRWKAALGVVLSSVVFFVVYSRLLQPWLTNHAQAAYWHFWSDFGDRPGTIVVNLLTSPRLVLVKLITSGWWHVFLPLLFLPFGSPRAVAGLAPTVFLLGVANYAQMHDYGGYYPSPLVAWALLGTLERAARLRARPYGLAVVATALLLFPLFEAGYARSVPVDWAKRATLETARDAFLAREATVRCVQPILMPQVGYPEHLTPLFALECLDQPGAVGLLLPDADPWPLEASTLAGGVEMWAAAGRVTRFGSFVLVGPPP
jgi:uncharacterized membrane protein